MTHKPIYPYNIPYDIYSALTQALSWNEDDDSGTTGEARSSLRIVVLEGMFSPVELLVSGSPG